MRFTEGFRDPVARALAAGLRAAAAGDRRLCFMEVCGTHTMAVGRHGLRALLPPNVRLVSGPGCPVCVTPSGYLDAALELGRRGAVLATFGDLLHAPAGDGRTLAGWRGAGGDVHVCYSPLEALALAEAAPSREVVFLAIGFETTIAPTLMLAVRAHRAGIRNVSLLTSFRRVVPAMEAVLATPDVRLDGFLCPPHVSTVIGADAYRPVAERYGRPCVVAGFEPLDVLAGLLELIRLATAGRAEVHNEYARVVTPKGNPRARALIEEWLTPSDAWWRGLGRLPDSGYSLRPDRAEWDAARRLGVEVGPGAEPRGCRCGDVVAGRIDPPECPLFGRRCTPDRPVGPCMVSSEGSCAAWYRYERAGRT